MLKNIVDRHCEERSDEAIPLFRQHPRERLLRGVHPASGGARNDIGKRLSQHPDKTLNRAALFCFIILFFGGCGPTEEDVRRMVREEMSRATARKVVSPVQVIGPYSPAVRIGNFLFVSGQIGLDQETGQLKNESIELETRQVLDNLSRVLHAEGYDSSHVVSATVYLKNMNDYPKMNLIYGGYFEEGNYPARTTVGVAELPKGANVEINVVAWKGQ